MAKQIKPTQIPPNEHVFIGGRTGTGKTWTARKYLTGYTHVAVLDTKGEFAWPEVGFHRLVTKGKNGTPDIIRYRNDNPEGITLVTHLADMAKVKTDKIIYRPAWEELNLAFYNSFYEWIYRRRNTVVFTDEAMSVSPNPSVIPEYYKACLTRGRELGIGVWSASQRPSGIAQIIISESNHILAFDLNMPQDRKKLAEISGAPEFLEKPGHFKFWYYNVNQENAILAQLKEG